MVGYMTARCEVYVSGWHDDITDICDRVSVHGLRLYPVPAVPGWSGCSQGWWGSIEILEEPRIALVIGNDGESHSESDRVTITGRV